MLRPAVSPGRLLERIGDDAPRGMTVLDRTRLTGRLRLYFPGQCPGKSQSSLREPWAPPRTSIPPLALRASSPLTQGAGNPRLHLIRGIPRFAKRIAGPGLRCRSPHSRLRRESPPYQGRLSGWMLSGRSSSSRMRGPRHRSRVTARGPWKADPSLCSGCQCSQPCDRRSAADLPITPRSPAVPRTPLPAGYACARRAVPHVRRGCLRGCPGARASRRPR
jgi:hypothetical protein